MITVRPRLGVIRICGSAVFLFAVFCFYGGPRLSALTNGNCSDICDGASDCNTGCLYNLDQEETCGDYGVCGFYYCEDICGPQQDCAQPCDPGNETTCGAYDGGEHGDNCHDCGNGYCGSGDIDDCCTQDCGPIRGCGTPPVVGCGQCNPMTGGGCGSGQICDAQACCQTVDVCAPLYGSCSTSADCCDGSDMCRSNFGGSPVCFPPAFAPAPKAR